MYEKCPPLLNIVLMLPCENEISHFIYFYNALLEQHLLHQVQRNKLIVTKYVQNVRLVRKWVCGLI